MASPEPVTARHDVEIAVDPVRLAGDLAVPNEPSAIVVFAHGSGSSRRSPRNVAVADRLNRSGLATLLFDLLTEAEAAEREHVFDIDLLATRLRGAVRWVGRRAELTDVPVALFGASTGAAAALVASASLHNELAAIVSRGGRPDLAGDALERVTVPTLLIVGGKDRQVLELNREARARLAGPSELEVVAGAGHLFEEPGALERVADLAAEWITDHLAGAPGDVSLLDVF
ncbi:MAG TPA: alpha/beta family hydrolase [Actinomycetota bacterium]|nr:alpha/beta family hydrolase [Actinomycetota bacterium]